MCWALRPSWRAGTRPLLNFLPLMKPFIFLSFLFSLAAPFTSRAAITSAGDLMFTGYNADGTDDLAFVLLQTYSANTVIYFSDNEWNGTGWTDTNESFFQWSSSVDLASGTIVTLGNIGGTGALASNLGSPSFAPVAIPVSGRGLAASNESVYAYLGSTYDTTTPTFLAAFSNSGFSASTGLLTNTGLTTGATATAFTNGHDVFAYTGDRTLQTSLGDYAALIGNTANWISEDGSGDQHQNGIGPDVPFNTTAFSAVPEPGTPLLLALVSSLGMLSYRRRY
jgi:uncharacterized protein